MGEALMRAPDPESALRDLVAAAEDRQSAGLPTVAYQP
jgi:hypothetical protein